jgi:hypothetical protein
MSWICNTERYGIEELNFFKSFNQSGKQTELAFLQHGTILHQEKKRWRNGTSEHAGAGSDLGYDGRRQSGQVDSCPCGQSHQDTITREQTNINIQI